MGVIREMIFKNILYNIERNRYIKKRYIEKNKYLEVVNNPSFRICNFSKECILELHNQYCLRYGRYPITVESIREAFKE